MSIRKKIFLSTFILALIICIALTTISLIQFFDIRDFVETANEKNVQEVSTYTEDELNTVSVNIIEGISDEMVFSVDQNFKQFEHVVASVAAFAETIYSGHPMPAAEDGNYLLMPGVQPQDVAAEVGSVLYLREYIQSLQFYKSYVGHGIEIYYESASGIFIDDGDYLGYGTSDIDFRERDWYLGATENEGPFWADMYTNVASNELTMTCSYPVYYGGTLVGVAAIDIDINVISETVLNVTSPYVKDVCLLDDELNVEYSSKDTGEVAAFVQREDKGRLLDFIGQVGDNYYGISSEGSQTFVMMPIPNTPWTVFIYFEFSDIVNAEQHITRTLETNNTAVMNSFEALLQQNILVFAIVILVVIVFTLLLAHRNAAYIGQPIEDLVKMTKSIGSGNLDFKFKARQPGPEVETIVGAFNDMTLSLKEYIANLAAVTAEKKRVETELDVANQIQKSMLPSIFPPFPERDEFDLRAFMDPAKEVGGDFYDFYMVDENHLAMVVADVSGKGIGAALFMVISKTVLKNTAQGTLTPEGTVTKVNDILCAGNDAEMFVTAFFAVLEVNTGKLTYVNAGHNPPIICGPGGCRYLKMKRNLPLACMEGVAYKQEHLQLTPGEQLFIYTDGVTEAFNTEEQMYGEGRLQEKLQALVDEKTPFDDILSAVHEDIDTFAGEEEQADDITMLMMWYKGPN